MCWQDVQIARQQTANQAFGTRDYGTPILFPADYRRVNVIIGAKLEITPSAGGPYVVITRNPADLIGAAVIYAGTLVEPFEFNYQRFGNLVVQAFYVVPNDADGSAQFSITEMILLDPLGAGIPNTNTPRG